MRTQAIKALSVVAAETLPNGVKVAIIPCENYANLKSLPQAIDYDGLRYGRTGWNSDRCIAYYRTDCKVAYPV